MLFSTQHFMHTITCVLSSWLITGDSNLVHVFFYTTFFESKLLSVDHSWEVKIYIPLYWVRSSYINCLQFYTRNVSLPIFIDWLIQCFDLYQYGFIDLYMLNYNPILCYLFCCNFAIESYFSWLLCSFDIFGFCLFYQLITFWTSLVAQMIKNLPAKQETQVQPLIWEGSLEKGMATHSSVLACRIPWTEERGRLWPLPICIFSLQH